MNKKTQIPILLLFTFLLFTLSACKKDTGVPKKGNFFYGVLDGQEIRIDGNLGQGSGLNGCGAFGINTYLNGGFWVDGQGASVILAENSREAYPSADFFYAMYEEGTYLFTPIIDCAFDVSTASISFGDAEGDTWNSTENQNNRLVITNRGESDGLQAIIEGTFECEVISTNTNEVKMMKSGEFRFPLGLY